MMAKKRQKSTWAYHKVDGYVKRWHRLVVTVPVRLSKLEICLLLHNLETPAHSICYEKPTVVVVSTAIQQCCVSGMFIPDLETFSSLPDPGSYIK
jgi:hypothetical protein